MPSVPDIPFVIVKFVPVKEPAIFFLEAYRPMVFALVADIVYQVSQLSTRHGKRATALLPDDD